MVQAFRIAYGKSVTTTHINEVGMSDDRWKLAAQAEDILVMKLVCVDPNISVQVLYADDHKESSVQPLQGSHLESKFIALFDEETHAGHSMQLFWVSLEESDSSYTIRVKAHADYTLSLRPLKPRKYDPASLDWHKISDPNHIETISYDAKIGDVISVCYQEADYLSTCEHTQSTNSIRAFSPSSTLPLTFSVNSPTVLTSGISIATLTPTTRGKQILFLTQSISANSDQSGYFLSIHRNLIDEFTQFPLITNHGPSQFILIEKLWEQAEKAFWAGDYDSALAECKRLLIMILLNHTENLQDLSVQIGQPLEELVPDRWQFFFQIQSSPNSMNYFPTSLIEKGRFKGEFSKAGDKRIAMRNSTAITYCFCKIPMLVGQVLRRQKFLSEALESFAIARDYIGCSEEEHIWIEIARTILSLTTLHAHQNSLLPAYQFLREIADETGTLPADSVLFRFEYPGKRIGRIVSSKIGEYDHGNWKEPLTDFVGQLNDGIVSTDLVTKFADMSVNIEGAAVTIHTTDKIWKLYKNGHTFYISDPDLAPNSIRYLNVYAARSTSFQEQNSEVLKYLQMAKTGHAMLSSIQISHFREDLRFSSLYGTIEDLTVPALKWETLLSDTTEHISQAERDVSDFISYLKQARDQKLTELELTNSIELNEKMSEIAEKELTKAQQSASATRQHLSDLQRNFKLSQQENEDKSFIENRMAELEGVLTWITASGPGPHAWFEDGQRWHLDTKAGRQISNYASQREELSLLLSTRSRELNRLEREQAERHLSIAVDKVSYELDVAEIGVEIARAKDMLSQLRVRQSKELLEAFMDSPLTVEQWNTLARINYLGAVAHILRAKATLIKLIQAFEFEFGVGLNTELSDIRLELDENDPSSLELAVEALKQIKGDILTKRTDLAKYTPVGPIEISLRTEFPTELYLLRTSGFTRFHTTLDYFIRKHPGIYNCRIKNIDIEIEGSLDKFPGILRNSGYSYYRRPRQGVALDNYSIADDLEKVLKLHDIEQLPFPKSDSNGINEDQLSKFENFGLESSWELLITDRWWEIYDVKLSFTFSAQENHNLTTHDCSETRDKKIESTTAFLLNDTEASHWKDDWVQNFKRKGEMEFTITASHVPYATPKLQWLRILVFDTNADLIELPLEIALYQPASILNEEEWMVYPVTYTQNSVGMVEMDWGIDLIGDWRLSYQPPENRQRSLDNAKEIVIVSKYFAYRNKHQRCGSTEDDS